MTSKHLAEGNVMEFLGLEKGLRKLHRLIYSSGWSNMVHIQDCTIQSCDAMLKMPL